MTEAETGGAVAGASAPTSPAEAKALHLQLMQDEAFAKSYLKGEPEAVDKVRHLYRSGTNVTKDLNIEANSRAKADTEQRIQTFLKIADLPPAVVEQMRSNAPVSAEERRAVELELGRMKADKEFVRNVSAGQRAARTRWTLAHIVLGSPVAGQR